MTIRFPNIPIEALTEIAEEVRQHGLEVVFESDSRGRVTCEAGKLDFDHTDGAFAVHVTEDRGHFPEKMLIGGLRQLVEEGVERYHRKVTA
jgi:hypothetical protein